MGLHDPALTQPPAARQPSSFPSSYRRFPSSYRRFFFIHICSAHAQEGNSGDPEIGWSPGLLVRDVVRHFFLVT